MKRSFYTTANGPTWSVSRDQQLQSCERKYFFQYVAEARINSPDPWLRGIALLKKLKAWDDEMVQRRSRAYDDVENFPNRFTANYLFLINHAESDLPVVNQPSLDRLAQMDGEWSALKARADQLTAEEIPALNKKLWALGVGAIWKK